MKPLLVRVPCRKGLALSTVKPIMGRRVRHKSSRFPTTMSEHPASEVTAILQANRQGNGAAAAQLLPQAYVELRKLAHADGPASARAYLAADRARSRGVLASAWQDRSPPRKPAALVLRRGP